jgi:hypothetical protein
VFQEGSKVFPSKGSNIVNYPKQQLDNGIAKNVTTGRRYKYMVRALKKLQSLLIDEGLVTAELPSYLIECLVFNVENDNFGHDKYVDDMRCVLAEIFNSTLEAGNWNDWEEVNELKYLYRGGKGWTHEQVHTFADAAWDYVGFN